MTLAGAGATVSGLNIGKGRTLDVAANGPGRRRRDLDLPDQEPGCGGGQRCNVSSQDASELMTLSGVATTSGGAATSTCESTAGGGVGDTTFRAMQVETLTIQTG